MDFVVSSKEENFHPSIKPKRTFFFKGENSPLSSFFLVRFPKIKYFLLFGANTCPEKATAMKEKRLVKKLLECTDGNAAFKLSIISNNQEKILSR